MSAKNIAEKRVSKRQEVCIDLPGESVQCWRDSDHVRVILRKHRDVFFDINLQNDGKYTVESDADFYSPEKKKILRTIEFIDGECCHIWVGREFVGRLRLKLGNVILGNYDIKELDTQNYGVVPKEKPEPFMIVMGEDKSSNPFTCTVQDRFGLQGATKKFQPRFESKFLTLKDLGTKYDYALLDDSSSINEYVAVTEARASEIQPQVLAQLERNVAIEGSVGQIFIAPKPNQQSLLMSALAAAVTSISGNATLNDTSFKEITGYIFENFKQLDKIISSVRIEKKAIGAYRVAIKGTPVSARVARFFGGSVSTRPVHWSSQLGSKESAFIDGGYGRTGRAGYGGFKRIFLTTTKNFGAGLKIQGVGTIIDLIVDVNTIFGNEKSSRDVSEFLGRAGVTLAKAGASAALGSFFAAASLAGLTAVFSVGAIPAVLVFVFVVAGFIGAAMLVDLADDEFNVKNKVAQWAK